MMFLADITHLRVGNLHLLEKERNHFFCWGVNPSTVCTRVAPTEISCLIPCLLPSRVRRFPTLKISDDILDNSSITIAISTWLERYHGNINF